MLKQFSMVLEEEFKRSSNQVSKELIIYIILELDAEFDEDVLAYLQKELAKIKMFALMFALFSSLALITDIISEIKE